MRREGSLEDISDGKLYDINDMVKADCGDCRGCYKCCQDMGESLVLDPLDVFNLCGNLTAGFEDLLAEKVVLNIYDGVILPSINMNTANKSCSFLDENGRCSIHAFRPGICRIFPLGRYYENGTFKYFLQSNQCVKENRTKVKINKWIDTPNIKENQRFILSWHDHVKNIEKHILETDNEDIRKKINMLNLNIFYLKPYDYTNDFYEQFMERLNMFNLQFHQLKNL